MKIDAGNFMPGALSHICHFERRPDSHRDGAEKSASVNHSIPDFSTAFASLTTVEMTPFLRHQPETADRRATKTGLTLVELLVALVVTAVILSAVAALAFAMTSAADATDDTSRKQAQLRYATLRLSELIRHCRLVCGTPDDALALWRADDNDDGQININELVYIERGNDGEYLRLCEFPSSDTSVVQLSDIGTLSPAGHSVTRVTLIPQCSNVQFRWDQAPPYSKFVSLSFDLSENDIIRHYQINTALRCWAGHLLNEDGTAIVSDDD